MNSQCYTKHLIINKFYPFNCWSDSLVYEKSVCMMYDHLLADYHPEPIWSLMLLLHLTHTLLISLLLFPVNLSYRDSLHSMFQISHPFSIFFRLFQRICPVLRPCVRFHNKLVRSHQLPCISRGYIFHLQLEDITCCDDRDPLL